MTPTETPSLRGDAHIDVHDAAACRFWSKLLGVPAKELERIVATVGDRVSDVESYLAEAQLHDYFEDTNTESNPT